MEDVVSLVAAYVRSHGAPGSCIPQLATDVVALLRGLKAAVMLDYVFRSRRLSAESNVHLLRGLLVESAAALNVAAGGATALPLGDCIWLLRPSLLRVLEPPLFVQLLGRAEARWAEKAEALSLGLACAAYTSAVAAAAVSGVIPAPPEASAILPPTLYGALLGYPSVYSLPSDQSEGAGWSLELTVVQLRACDSIVASFSVPTHLLGCDVLQRCGFTGLLPSRSMLRGPGCTPGAFCNGMCRPRLLLLIRTGRMSLQSLSYRRVCARLFFDSYGPQPHTSCVELRHIRFCLSAIPFLMSGFDCNGAVFLRSVSVGKLLSERSESPPLFFVFTTDTIGDVLDRLAAARILSAPLLLRLDADKMNYQVLGFISVGDLVRAFAVAWTSDIGCQDGTQLSRSVALADLGSRFATTPVLSVHTRDDDSVLQFEGEVVGLTLLDLARRLLRLPHQRPPLQPLSRIAVYTARGGISAIISLTDIIRYISSHASELAGLVSRTLLELGLLCKPLRTVPSTMPTDEVLRSLTDEPIVGVVDENTHLVASFSQSDLRGVGTSAFGCLALPVGEYLVQRLGVIAPATAEGDAWAAALREAKTAICLAPDASLADAMCAVVDKRMHHVFVEGRPRENVYVVSLADLLDSGAMSGTPDGLRMAYGMHPGLRSSKSVI